MESLNVQDVMQRMNRKKTSDSTGKVMFAAELGKNCCKTCQELHGRIFPENDSGKPEIPLHPNCRCRYIRLD